MGNFGSTWGLTWVAWVNELSEFGKHLASETTCISNLVYIYTMCWPDCSELARPPAFQCPLGRQVGLQVGLVLPSWASKSPWTAKLDCQGALGRHSGLQLGVQVPLQSAPDLQICSTVRHFSHFFRNCNFWSPSALGLLFGSSWGLLGCLSGSTWSLLGASWAQLGVSGAPLAVILGPSGRLLGFTWASWAPPGPT